MVDALSEKNEVLGSCRRLVLTFFLVAEGKEGIGLKNMDELTRSY